MRSFGRVSEKGNGRKGLRIVLEMNLANCDVSGLSLVPQWAMDRRAKEMFRRFL
jgi:hypothetical protein